MSRDAIQRAVGGEELRSLVMRSLANFPGRFLGVRGPNLPYISFLGYPFNRS
jgi:hypothetical protein